MLEWLPNPFVIPVGLIVGVLIAAPVGPVNIIVIQRAIERGMFGGWPGGAGAVLADGLIAFLAALGVGAISNAVEAYRYPIQAVGGLVLLAFAILLMRRKPYINVEAKGALDRDSLLTLVWDAPKAFLMTITNPGAVLGLFAIFGGISSFVEVRGKIDALAMVAAIMAGSMAWWVGLSALVARIRDRLDPAWIARINMIAAALLMIFAAVLIGELLFEILRRGV
ncbi:MAG: LysE family transporter [Pseudomonadota bacterium]